MNRIRVNSWQYAIAISLAQANLLGSSKMMKQDDVYRSWNDPSLSDLFIHLEANPRVPDMVSLGFGHYRSEPSVLLQGFDNADHIDEHISGHWTQEHVMEVIRGYVHLANMYANEQKTVRDLQERLQESLNNTAVMESQRDMARMDVERKNEEIRRLNNGVVRMMTGGLEDV